MDTRQSTVSRMRNSQWCGARGLLRCAWNERQSQRGRGGGGGGGGRRWSERTEKLHHGQRQRYRREQTRESMMHGRDLTIERQDTGTEGARAREREREREREVWRAREQQRIPRRERER